MTDHRYSRSGAALSTGAGEHLVVVDLVASEYLLLNRAAAHVWHGLEHADSIPGLLDFVAARYSGDRTQMRIDVAQLLDALVARGLVVRS